MASLYPYNFKIIFLPMVTRGKTVGLQTDFLFFSFLKLEVFDWATIALVFIPQNMCSSENLA